MHSIIATALTRLICFVVVALLFFAGSTMATAQGLTPDTTEILKAKVLEVESSETRNVPGTDAVSRFQTIKAQIIEGEREGEVVTIEDDYLNLEAGDVFFLSHTQDTYSDNDYYAVNDPYRLPQLGLLVGLFVLAVFVFGGIQGVRGLASLIGSFLIIFYVLLPALLAGYSPILITVAVSSLIIIVGSYITHGVNKTTSAAVIGMVITVTITGLLAYWSVYYTQLTGFAADEAVYLNLNSRGSIDIVGLLLGGIMIGLLGVLYDAAIGQAISVEELLRIAPHVKRKKIYQRAIRIGREHIGALVNTLAIAYVGAALPLLLLFYQSSTTGIWHVMNTEIFATEIVRIMIGSIGLILAVPITTAVALWILTLGKKRKEVPDEVLEDERAALEHATHTH